MTFAARLKALREARGITSYRLAMLTGLTKQGTRNLEAEGSDPKLSTLLKVAEALGTTVAELAGETRARKKK